MCMWSVRFLSSEVTLILPVRHSRLTVLLSLVSLSLMFVYMCKPVRTSRFQSKLSPLPSSADNMWKYNCFMKLHFHQDDLTWHCVFTLYSLTRNTAFNKTTWEDLRELHWETWGFPLHSVWLYCSDLLFERYSF